MPKYQAKDKCFCSCLPVTRRAQDLLAGENVQKHLKANYFFVREGRFIRSFWHLQKQAQRTSWKTSSFTASKEISRWLFPQHVIVEIRKWKLEASLQMVWGFMKWLYQKERQDFLVSEILPRVMLWKKIMSGLQIQRRKQLFAHKVVENTRTVTWDLTRREQRPCAAREMFKERVQGSVSSIWGAAGASPIWQHRGSEGLPEPMGSTLQRNKTESLSLKSLGMKTSEKGHSNNFLFSLGSTATGNWRASGGVV